MSNDHTPGLEGVLARAREELDRIEKMVDREARLARQAHASLEECAEPVGRESVKPSGAGATLLVVDDDDAFRGFVAQALERLGYDVVEAAEPGEAMEIIRNRPGEFELLLVDIMLPGASGRDLVKEVLAVEKGVEILYMSGYAGEDIVPDDVYTVMEGGAELLQKPFTPEELSGAVRLKLSEKGRGTAD